MVYDSDLERQCSLSDMERTAKVIANIANSLDQSIQVTIDTPERNGDLRLPVLDLRVWICNNQIVHSFLKKAVSSLFTILKRSAIFQEGIKRISHISLSLL